jgi:outer membrane protein assembly factor BamB
MNLGTTSCILLLAGAAAQAGDWPMWRYDAERSAAAPGDIAQNPTLLWSRQLPPVRPAWPLERLQRLNFDASYEPVVLGKRLFLGSPNDGSVTAYSTDTGEELWKFFTDGPVRCALACWRDKVYAGSDDGFLYCLEASSGAVAWRFRGAPATRPDRRHLGNGYLISFWPVRGGPVIKADTVYFGTGIWPTFGVFLCALDASTGRLQWRNDAVSHIVNVRTDHDNLSESGLSPQGHFVAIDDKLIVPCGRSMPAGFDRESGRLLYYTQGYRNGHSRVAAHGAYAFVGDTGLVNLNDFREAGSHWAERGSQPPEGYQPRDWKHMGLFESPFHLYKTAEGCDADSVFTDNTAYGNARGTFYAYDLKAARRVVQEQIGSGLPIKKALTWHPRLLWAFKSHAAGKMEGPTIKAGNRLYGSAGRMLMALESLGANPGIAWEKEIDGTPSAMIAADDKLFVATQEGWIHCFGEGPPGKAHPATATPIASGDDGWRVKAEQIIKAARTRSGYCLVLGLSQGRLIEELLRQTNFMLLAVDAQAGKISDLRQRFGKAGVLGARVAFFTGDPRAFPFPPCLASVIVSEDPVGLAQLDNTGLQRLFDTLRPYGGTLCLEMPEREHADFEKRIAAAALAGGRATRVGGLSLLAREGPLPGSAPWAQEYTDAARTLCSADDLVKPPLGFLWYGDDPGFVLRNHGFDDAKPLVNGGRVYALAQHTKYALVYAYDAYTGRFLWKNEIPCTGRYTRLAAPSDGIYFISDNRCIVYAPESGATLRTFTWERPGGLMAKDLRIDGDGVVIACGDDEKDRIFGGPNDYRWLNALVCLDRRTGAEKWRRPAGTRFHNGAFAAGGGAIFVIEPLVSSNAAASAASAAAKPVASVVHALDAQSGKPLWSRTLVYQGVPPSAPDWLAYSATNTLLLCGRGGIANALNAKSGAPLWENVAIMGLPPLVRERTFLAGSGMYDLLTGALLNKDALRRTGTGCNTPLAGRHLILVRDSSVSFTEIDGGRTFRLGSVRSGCVNSLIAADGLLNVPDFNADCVCNYPIQTSFAMIHMPEVAAWSGTPPLTLTPPPARPAMESGLETLKER